MCLWEVLRDLGLRCVLAPTGAEGHVAPGLRQCPFMCRDWVFRNDEEYTRTLRELGRLTQAGGP